MRKQTVNVITLYMSVGAAVNILSILFIVGLDLALTESILTIAMVNGCYVQIARDIARKHEQVCANKNWALKRNKTPGVTSHR